MKKIRSFGLGEVIPGLMIHGEPAPYPVVNEREVRAVAGLMLAVALIAFAYAFFLQSFVLLQVVVVVFFVDFTIRVFVGMRWSPFAFLARLIVGRQRPEWVGAIQKRFAWSMGIGLALLMILVLFVLDIRGPLNLIICSICLLLLWMESAFGICVGCKLYYGLIKIGVLKEPTYRPACSGGVCSIHQ